MIKCILTVLLVLTTSITIAQDFKIHILYNGNLISQAELLINKKVISKSNSDGVVILNKENLSNGDVIEASYNNSVSEKIIWNTELSRQKETFIYIFQNLVLDEVVVKGELDVRKFLKAKSDFKRDFNFKKHQLTGEYKYSEKKNGLTESSEGEIMLLRSKKGIFSGIYNEFTVSDKNISKPLYDALDPMKDNFMQFVIAAMLSGSQHLMAISSSNNYEWQYTGTENNSYVFIASNIKETTDRRPLKYVYYIDKDNKYIKSVTIHYAHSDRNNSTFSITTIDFQLVVGNKIVMKNLKCDWNDSDNNISHTLEYNNLIFSEF